VLLIQPVDALRVCALLTAGARWAEWKWPSELGEHPDEAIPPINTRDVAAFVEALSFLPDATEPSS
jgi:hypothetical protein